MVGDDDHYQTLGIGRGASKAEVKAAFGRLAQLHHPDRYETSDAAARDAAACRFRAVYDAYGVLYDDTARAEYDLRLRSSSASSGGYRHRHGGDSYSSSSWGTSGGHGHRQNGHGGGSRRRPPPPKKATTCSNVFFWSLVVAEAALDVIAAAERAKEGRRWKNNELSKSPNSRRGMEK